MPRTFDHRLVWLLVVAATAVMAASIPSAQAPVHLNAIIEKLAQGKPVFGVAAGDLSMENAHAVARADVDFVRIEMEHAPLNFDALRLFLVGTIDKTAILKKGNAQLNVAAVARFAPDGREHADWVPKQALDVGLMGVIFNDVDNKEQAPSAVRSMRYPQRNAAANSRRTEAEGRHKRPTAVLKGQ